MSAEPDVFGRLVDDRGRKILSTGPIDRPHYAASVSGCTDDALWKRLMLEWYGLTPARGLAWLTWAWCPHRLAGRRCSGDRCTDDGGRPRTWRDRFQPIWDHARAWRTADGELVLTLEPYGNPFDVAPEYAAMVAELDALGVVAGFEGRSPYGASYIVFVAHKDTDLGRRAEWLRGFTWWRDGS